MRVRPLAVLMLVTMPLAATSQGPAVRNPKYIRAVELLRPAREGVPPRIRFEWERVPGSREYVLIGQWTDAHTWEVRSREYRVTARNAARWASDEVTFDVSLPVGSHSWKIVAVFDPDDTGDFVSPSHVSFTLR